MSATLSTLRFNVRSKLGDMNLQEPAVKGWRLDQAISDNMQLISGRLNMPLEWATITALTAGDDDYTVAKEYHSIALFRIAATKNLVEKVPHGELARWKEGPDVSRAEPLLLAVREAAPTAVGTTEVSIQLWPTPKDAGTLEGLLSEIPAVVSADTGEVPLPEFALRAVEYAAAAELAALLVPQALERIGLSDQAAAVFNTQAERFIEWEQTRTSRQRSSRFANRSSPG